VTMASVISLRGNGRVDEATPSSAFSSHRRAPAPLDEVDAPRPSVFCGRDRSLRTLPFFFHSRQRAIHLLAGKRRRRCARSWRGPRCVNLIVPPPQLLAGVSAWSSRVVSISAVGELGLQRADVLVCLWSASRYGRRCCVAIATTHRLSRRPGALGQQQRLCARFSSRAFGDGELGAADAFLLLRLSAAMRRRSLSRRVTPRHRRGRALDQRASSSG